MEGDKRSRKILVVDDEEDITDLVCYHLESEGFVVEAINDPNHILGVSRDFEPDLFVLDIMMPGLNGIQICRMIRADKRFGNVPVVFLTAKAEGEDRILGLETGADDYICKPFSIKELVLRIKAVLKRSQSNRADQERGPLQVRDVLIDEDHYQLRVGGDPVELTATEFKLLKLMVKRKGRVQTRENLLQDVWNYEGDTETRTVDTHIRRLREKLGAQANIIETIRGVGYRVVSK